MQAPQENTLRRLSADLALLGVGVATYIAIADSGGGGCEAVAGSAYSHLFGGG